MALCFRFGLSWFPIASFCITLPKAYSTVSTKSFVMLLKNEHTSV